MTHTEGFKCRNFIQSEVDFIKGKCNFTEEEETFFDMKCKDASDIQVAMKLNISDRKVTELSQRVKTKIIKVAIS
jgi:hypothetical protein